jgi:hypothetical protein
MSNRTKKRGGTMARNETYALRLDHEGCPNKGEARLREPENPVHHPGEGPKVDQIPAGFGLRFDDGGKVEIVCKICNRTVAVI